MRSIQSKLSTGLLLSLIIAFSLLWLLVSINLQYLAKEYIQSRLTMMPKPYSAQLVLTVMIN